MKAKRESKAQREKKTAKSGNLSVMEKQNKLRAEAAKKKKEEAKQKRAEAKAAGGNAESNPSAYASGMQKMSKATNAIKAGRRMGGMFDQPEAPDISDHFESENFAKTVDQVKELSEESCMRKVNAQTASKAFKVFIK